MAIPSIVGSPVISKAIGAVNGRLKAGGILEVSVNFSEVVTVTDIPQLALLVGTTPVAASYASGSGTQKLVFSYTVGSGMLDTNGVSVAANALSLNAGSIKGATGTNASLSHAAALDNARFLIDSVDPTVASADFTSAVGARNGWLNVGDTVTASLTFSEVVTVTGLASASGTTAFPSLGLNLGGNTVQAKYLSGSGSAVLRFVYTVTSGVYDADGLSFASNALALNGASIKDMAGNAAVLSHAAVTDNAAYKVDGVAATASMSAAVVNTAGKAVVSGSEVGVAYLVDASVKVGGLTDILGLSDSRFNSVELTAANTPTDLLATGLQAGVYKLYVSDRAGNLSADIPQTLTVDLTAPVVSGAKLTGATGMAGGLANAGDVITASVTFSEVVLVTGTPKVSLMVGSTPVAAAYSSGSGSKQINFTYTVTADMVDANGVGIVANSLALDGGTLRDVAGNNAVLSHAVVADNASFKVDAVAPVLSALSISGAQGITNSLLDTGDVVTLKATFSEVVVVSGTPQLALSIGNTTVQASYASGSNSKILYFVYTVANGLTDANGIAVAANALTLNGGSISDTAGTAAVLSHASLADNAAYKVNSVVPGVTGFSLSSGSPMENDTLNAGDVLTVSYNFSQAVVVSGKPSVAIDVGGKTVQAVYASGSASDVLSFTYTVLAGNLDANGISINANALKLNTGGSINLTTGAAAQLTHAALADQSAFKVDSVAPTLSGLSIASATGLASVSADNAYLNAGDVVTLKADFSEAVLVTGNPTLSVMVGTTAVKARYDSGSGTASLNFVYTVQSGHNDANGLSLNAGALALEGGSIKDAAGTAAVLSNAAVTDNPLYKVDTTAATISSVSFSGAQGRVNQTLNAGDTVTVSVNFSEAVKVTGTPVLALTLGTQDVQASYLSGSGGTTLRFVCTIASGQVDTDGLSIAPDKLSLSGGSITDVADNASNLSHAALAANAAYKVDAVVPLAPTVALGTGVAGNANEAEALQSSGVITVQGEAGTVITVNMVSNSKTVSKELVATGASQAVVLTSLDLNTLGDGVVDVTVTQTDTAGNVSAEAAVQFDLQTRSPTLKTRGIDSAQGVQNGWLNAGDVLTLALVYSEVVTVTGQPTLNVVIGSTTVQAAYASGSGADTLLFTYTIQAGQTDSDGVALPANALSLNGGSIKDSVGNNATLTSAALLNQAGYKVDTTAPDAISLSMATDTGVSAADKISNSGVMNIGTLETNATWQYSTNGGSTWAAGSGSSFTLAAGSYAGSAVQVRQIDQAGNTGAATASAAAITVDATAPTVSSVAITSATGAQNSLLNAGDVITAAVTFSEATSISGTPQLGLNIGGTTVQANYTATGSTSTVKNFVYTVQGGQTDANGVSVNANSLTLNSGSIIDTAGNNATLTHAAVADNASYAVDAAAPTVSSVVISSATGAQNNLLNAGDVITAAVTFSEATTVTGTPQLGLNIGGSTVQANYSATGSTSTVKNFVYTIAAGQTDANGISVDANSLAFNSGSITDTAGTNATLTHAAVADNASYKVDTTIAAPTLAVTDSGTSNTDGVTNVNTFTVGNVLAGDTWEYTTNGGLTWTAGSGASFTAPVAAYQPGSIRVRASDAAGNLSFELLSSETFDTSTAGWVSTAAFGSVAAPTVLAAPMNGFLGRLSDGTRNQVVSKTYDFGSAYAGKTVTVDFDMYKLDSWDSELFDVFINNERVSTRNLGQGNTTFNGVSLGNLSNASNGGWADPASTEELQHYTLLATLDASGRVKLGFGSGLAGTIGLSDESWGIDNVVISMGSGTYANPLTIDQTGPTVSSVTIKGATGLQNSTLNAGDVVTAAVTFNEATTVTGTPQLGLDIGGTTVQANYTATGSTSTVKNFVYTIAAGQTDANGISVNANSLALNSGSITDTAGNNATLTHAAMADNASYSVDTTAPTVSGVAISGATGIQNSLLNAGDVVTAAVTFNEATTVTGTPQLGLNIGGTTVQASYSATGSTSTVKNFVYTIAAGQTDANGISVNANSLALNSGSITDTAGNNATLTHAAVADNASYKVDTTVSMPTLSLSTDTGSSGSDRITNTNTFTVGNVAADETWQYTVDSGVTWTAGTGSTFTAAPGSYGLGAIQVRALDTAGNQGVNNLPGPVSSVRYVMMYQNGTSSQQMRIGEVEVISGGSNIALNKTVTSKLSSGYGDIWLPAKIADGVKTGSGGYASSESTTDNWVQIDLGGLYTIDQINFYERFDTGTDNAGHSNIGIFVSATDMSTQSYSQLLSNAGALQLGTTVFSGSAAGEVNTFRQLTIDQTVPTVSAVAIVAATGIQNGLYNAGDVITAAVTFNEVTNVTGTPQLTLNVGGALVQANYTATGSTSTVKNFVYTIAAGQVDANGISINANSLSLNSGTLSDVAGNSATLTHAAVADNASYIVDTTASTISAVSLTSATGAQGSMLNVGDIVTATVTFNDQQLVTGTPQLALNIGGTTVQANYASGAGTTQLNFTYSVASGLTDANGISIGANGLILNSGSITDIAGNASTLTHSAVADNASFQVENTTPPAAPTLAMGGSYTTYGVDATAGSGLSNIVSVTGASGTTLTVTFASQNGTSVVKTLTATGSAQSVSLTAAEATTLNDGVVSVFATATDGAGKISQKTTLGTGLLADLPDSFTVGTASGMTLRMVSKVVSPYGDKVYYLNDLNGDGIINASDTRDQNAYDTLLNGGADVVATPGGVAGIDDARTLVLNGYTLVMPTRDEWYRLDDNTSVQPLNTWPSDMAWFTNTLTMFHGADLGTPDYHYALWYQKGYVWSQPGFSGDAIARPAVFQVIPNGSFRLNNTAMQVVGSTLSFEDFSGSTVTGWNVTAGTTSTATATAGSITAPASLAAPVGGYLGRFAGTGGTQGVSKTYDFGVGNAGKVVEIDLDMYEMDSWENETFQVYVNDALTASKVLNGQYGNPSSVGNNGGVNLGDLSVGSNGGLSTALTGFYGDEMHHFTLRGTLDANGRIKLGFGSTLDEAVSNESWGVDNILIRTFNAAPASPAAVTASVAENTATSSVAYDGRVYDYGTVSYTLSGTDAALFNVNSRGEVFFNSRPDFEAPADANGDNVYQLSLTTSDMGGNTLTRNLSLSVTNVAETATTYRVGQSMIDLGGYGRLIKPVYVDGKWYYYWDRSGDGSNAYTSNPATGASENAGSDTVDHDTLDKLFRYSSDFSTANPGGFGADTTNTYRYATLNGVKLALPTYGGPVNAAGVNVGGGYSSNTPVTALLPGASNTTYDDMLAIWDAYAGMPGLFGGVPAGWSGSWYWSATAQATGGHSILNLADSVVSSSMGTTVWFVALEVIGTFAAISGATGMSNGSLVAGSVVTASVYFTDAVTTTGTLSLKLSVGGQAVNASYAAGMNTNKLDFTYTIAAGQNDADGIVILRDGLSVTGGTLNRVAGGAADIAIAQTAPNSFYSVDAAAPVLDLNGAVSGTAMTSFYGAKSMPGVVLRGVDEYVDMPDLSLGGSMTFEARVRLDSNGLWPRLWDYNGGQATNDLFYSVPGVVFLSGMTPSQISVAGTSLNQWSHIAVSAQAPVVVGGVVQTNGYVDVYADGVRISNTVISTASQMVPLLTRINSWLGRSSYGSDSYLDGSISDFRIYNRARTAAEIAGDVLGTVDTTDTSLVAYHSFASSAASGLAGQSAGTLMNGAFVGGVTANRAIVYETSAVSQVRVTAAGMLNGAAEKFTIQGTQVSLDGTAATGSVTLDTDVWNWSATANAFTFTLAAGNATVAQTDKLVQALGYLNTQATPSEGNRTLSFVVTDSLGNQSAPTVHTITVDNTAPVFADATTVSLNLSEVSTWSGVNVLSVSATDASTAAGGKITYRLTGADASKFAVDALGNITLRSALDFDVAGDANADNVYSFAVNALDEAGNFSSKTVSLTLQNAVEALDLNGSAINGSALTLNYDRRAANVLNMSGNAASLPSFTLGGAFTIEVNAWYDNTNSNVPIGFTRSDGTSFGISSWPAGSATSSGQWNGNLGASMSAYVTSATSPEYGKFYSNQWNHLAYVWSGNGTMTVYVNGVQQVSWIFGPNLSDISTQIVFGSNNANQFGWTGSMRDIRVYDDARTVDEIRADMRGIIDLTDADLKAHYAIDGGSAASSLSGQAALTLGSGNSLGVLRLLDNATVSNGVVGMKVRVGFSGVSNGASEKLLVGTTAMDLDSTTAGSGTVTVGSDSWSWSRSGSVIEFTTTANNNVKTQALLNVMNYRNDAGTVTDGARSLSIVLAGQERPQLYLADDNPTYGASTSFLNASGVWVSTGSTLAVPAKWGVKRSVTLAEAGSYIVSTAADDGVEVFIDGQFFNKVASAAAVTKTLTLSAGNHELYFVMDAAAISTPNPAALAFTISKASDSTVVYNLVNDLTGSATETVYDTQTVTINVDMTAPVFGSGANTTTVSVAENTTTATTVFNANATDASGSITYTLSGEDADRFVVSNTGAVTFKTRPDFENARDINGDNVYKFNVTATDANGNSAHKVVSLSVTDVASDTGGYQSPKGQSVIDLGSFGKLILPVEVNGKTFYYWDRSGDGSINNGGQYNGGIDYVETTSQAAINALFKYASDFNTQNSGTQINDTFRYATLNGVRVALPTLNGDNASNGSINYAPTQTRHADGSTTNPVYDDLLAVWDAFNGVRTDSAFDNAATALGWAQNYFLSSGTADNGANQMMYLPTSAVYSTGVNAPSYYIALQVL